MVVGTISGAVVGTGAGRGVGTGAGEGADDRQMGVVGVESASVSMSVCASEFSLLGDGVIRSRIVIFFFFFFGFEMFKGDGFAPLGVRMTD